MMLGSSAESGLPQVLITPRPSKTARSKSLCADCSWARTPDVVKTALTDPFVPLVGCLRLHLACRFAIGQTERPDSASIRRIT
jgi:hypothetical protein